jgi:hypothetical protein
MGTWWVARCTARGLPGLRVSERLPGGNGIKRPRLERV